MNKIILPCLYSLIKDKNIDIVNNKNNQIFIESLITFSSKINNQQHKHQENESFKDMDTNKLILNIILNYFKTDIYINNPFNFDPFLQFLKINNLNYLEFLKSILNNNCNIPSTFQYYFLDKLFEYINENNLFIENFNELFKNILVKNKNDKIILNKFSNFSNNNRFIKNEDQNQLNKNEIYSNYIIEVDDKIIEILNNYNNFITSKEILLKFIQGIDKLFSLEYLTESQDILNLIDCIKNHPSFKLVLDFLKVNFDSSTIEWLLMDIEILNQFYKFNKDEVYYSNKFNFYLKCLNLFKLK